ncbi:MAG: hypothetical protein AB1551_06065 [Actinomycetota bacterium]
MKTTGRVALIVTICALLAAGCTGGDSNGDADVSPNATWSPSFSVPPGTALYVYSFQGLVATLALKDARGTLEIQNRTGRELPPPRFYILAAEDGHRVDGAVASPAAVPDGRTMSFEVSFGGLAEEDIGLVVLLMGTANYGAFIEQ